MEIAASKKGNRKTYSFIGKLCTPDDVARLGDQLGDVADGTKQVLVDLSRLTFTNSHGLGRLVGINRTLHEVGVKLVLLAPRPDIRDAIELSSIHTLIPVVDTQEDADRAFADTS